MCEINETNQPPKLVQMSGGRLNISIVQSTFAYYSTIVMVIGHHCCLNYMVLSPNNELRNPITDQDMQFTVQWICYSQSQTKKQK
jgi:hypothetical protein